LSLQEAEVRRQKSEVRIEKIDLESRLSKWDFYLFSFYDIDIATTFALKKL
jgi:hypothetical protein